jgi:hypothetical protein
MTARFECHVERAAPRPRSSPSERNNLRVGKTGPNMIALSDNPTAGNDDGPHERIGTRRAPALGRQSKGQRHVAEILCVGSRHYARRLVTNRSRRPGEAEAQTHEAVRTRTLRECAGYHRFFRAARDRRRVVGADAVDLALFRAPASAKAACAAASRAIATR